MLAISWRPQVEHIFSLLLSQLSFITWLRSDITLSVVTDCLWQFKLARFKTISALTMYVIEYLARNWRYSNAPEGQAPFEKVVGLTKFGFGASLGIGIYDCILLTQAYQFWEVVNCMSYWMVPITAMCATFASAAYTVTKVRGQDGYINYIIASLASGGVFYKWQKRGQLSYVATVAIIAGAMVKKHHDFIGEKAIPIETLKVRTSNAIVPFDFSLVKDPRGTRPWEQ